MSKKKDAQKAVMADYVSVALGKVRAGKIPKYIQEDLTKEEVYSLARELGIRSTKKFYEEMLTVAVFCDLYAKYWKDDQTRKNSTDPPMTGAELRRELARTKKAVKRIKDYLERLQPDFIDETMWIVPDPEAPRQKPTDEVYTIIDVTSDIKELVAFYTEHLDQIQIPRGAGGPEYQPGRLAAEALGYFLFDRKADLTRNEWIDAATRILMTPLEKHGFDDPSFRTMVDRARETLKLSGLRVEVSK